MTISNGYCTLADIKEHLGIGAEDQSLDALLERAVEAASRSIDRFCNRRFTLDTAATTKLYRPTNAALCLVDDIGDSASVIVKSDDTNDGTYATTWTLSTQYILEPTNFTDRPITMVTAVGRYFYDSPWNRPTVQVTAKWGWPSVPTDIEAACIILAARIYRRKDSPEGILGFGDLGVVRVSPGDRDVTALIAPYKRRRV